MRGTCSPSPATSSRPASPPCTTRGVRPDAGDRETIRGKVLHVGPRLSMTAVSADLFVPCAPGTEGFVALGIAHVMVRDRLTAASAAAGRLCGRPGRLVPRGGREEDRGPRPRHRRRRGGVFPEPARPGDRGNGGRDRLRRVVPLRRRGAPERPRGERGEARRGVVPEPSAGVREVRGGGRPARPSPESGYAAMRAALEKMRGGAFRMAILAGATNPAFTLPPSLKSAKRCRRSRSSSPSPPSSTRRRRWPISCCPSRPASRRGGTISPRWGTPGRSPSASRW